jgi:adenylyltransferase and sulfurtransferase
LNRENAKEIVEGWDIVMDGSDNAATRYLINDICIIMKKPLVSGSALQLEGQITVYGLRGGPCYRCMFPEPPPAHTVVNCSDGGVLGMVPGLIGNLQSIEIVKIILGFSDEQILNRRMIFFDASNMKFRNVKLRDRNPACVVCGDAPSLTDVSTFDYDSFCQVNCSRYALIKIAPENNITVEEFANVYNESIKPNKGDNLLIDVRPALQYTIVSLEGSLSIPLAQLKKDPSELKKIAEGKDKIYVMCRRGNASKDATEFLVNQC